MRELSKALVVLALAACNGADPLAASTQTENPSPLDLDAGVAPESTLPPETPTSRTDGGVEGIMFDPSGRPIYPDAGTPPPVPLTPDVGLPAEVLGREDLSGIALEAVFRWRQVPAPPKAPEVSAEGIAAAQKVTSLTMNIDLLSGGRMKLVMASRALPLPFRAEIRSRVDRYGHIAMWPGALRFRIVAPGALRPALGEGRVDVTPLSAGTKGATSTGKRLGMSTRVVPLESPFGRIRLELASVPEAAQGGPLLCRALVELVSIDPKTPECRGDEVPVAASIDWEQGGIDFEVLTLTKRTDFPPGQALVPPPGAELEATGLPEAPLGVFLTNTELALMRNKDLDIKSQDPAAPGEGFIAQNHRATLTYLLIDGVAVAAVPPRDTRYVVGLRKGRYTAQWRTFLGDYIGPVDTLEVPGVARVGKPDAVDAGVP